MFFFNHHQDNMLLRKIEEECNSKKVEEAIAICVIEDEFFNKIIVNVEQLSCNFSFLSSANKIIPWTLLLLGQATDTLYFLIFLQFSLKKKFDFVALFHDDSLWFL